MGRRVNDINEQGRGSVLKEKQKILGLVNLSKIWVNCLPRKAGHASAMNFNSNIFAIVCSKSTLA